MILREKYNLSLLFLLPLISEENENWYLYTGEYDMSTDRSSSFVNGYYMDINKPWLNNHIFLMFETAIDTTFDLKKTKRNANFQTNYLSRIAGKFYSIYSFAIPDKFKRDYSFLLKGEYTRISDEAKAKIIEFWIAGPNTALFKSMYNDKEIFQKFTDEIIGEEDFIDRYAETITL